jgi:tripartite-type tricarboxylate transporter receptor subunit TctC
MFDLETFRKSLGAMLLVAAGLSAPAASAQTPQARIVVGFPPGGSADITARLIADHMKDTLGVPVRVENRPGAGGRVAAQHVKEAAPDGTTLMLVPFAVMVIQPMVFSNLKYDTTRDFTPLSTAVTFPLAVAVASGNPSRNLSELSSWLKANPGKANFGTPGAGSMPHFMGEMLSQRLGTKLTHVPFQGGAPLLANLIGDQIGLGIDTPAEFAENHRAGKVRVVATSGAARASQFPEVATLREQGVDIDASAWFGVFGPAGLPAATAERLSDAVGKALREPAIVQRLASLGLTAAPDKPQDLRARMGRDIALWGPAVQASGFKAEN